MSVLDISSALGTINAMGKSYCMVEETHPTGPQVKMAQIEELILHLRYSAFVSALFPHVRSSFGHHGR